MTPPTPPAEQTTNAIDGLIILMLAPVVTVVCYQWVRYRREPDPLVG